MSIAKSGLTTPRQDLQGAFNQGLLDFTPACLHVMRPFGVDKETGTLEVIPLDVLAAAPTNLQREKDGSFPNVGRSRSNVSFALQAYGIEENYDDEDRSELEDSFAIEANIAQRIQSIVYRDQERRFAAIMNATDYAAGTRGHTAANKWSDPANGDPAFDIKKGIQNRYDATGFVMDTLVCDWASVWDMQNNNNLWKNAKYVNNIDGTPNLTLIAQQLGIQRIVVMGGRVNSAKEGQTASLSKLSVVSGTGAFLCKTAQTDSIDDAAWGRCLYSTQYVGLMNVDQYRKDGIEADIFRAKQKVQEKVLWNELGYLIQTVA